MGSRVAGLAPLAVCVLAACTPAAKAPAPPATAQAPAPARIVDTSFDFRGAITQGGLAIGRLPPGATSPALDGRPLPVDREGRFLIGFGRDAAPTAFVEARLPDGTVLREALRVTPRVFKIESIPSLRQNSTPNPEYEKLRAAEQARIAAARAVVSANSGWSERFVWPAKGRISGVYGSQRILGGVPRNPHSGVDVAAWTGTPVVAPAGGTVVLAADKPFSLEGNLLIIDHGNGLFSNFLHLSRIDVRVGQQVVQGQPVGAIGATGRATGPHLHWAMSWGDVRVDPQLTVPPM